MNNKYERLKIELQNKKTGKMKCFGNSMLPILPSGGLITFVKADSYEIGDMVFCKVKGRYIDCHLITKKDSDRYLISNNHGHDNGWTRTIFGKATQVEINNSIKTL